MQDKEFTFKQVGEERLTVYDARKKPFRIYGLWHPEEEGVFRRMPEEVAEAVSPRVKLLHTNTAGARLRFVTDSTVLAVGAIHAPTEFPSPRTAALCYANSFFFDLYADGSHCHVLWHEGAVADERSVHLEIPDGHYESVVRFSEKREREITLCFPSFVNIEEVFIGVEEGAVVKESTPYVNEGRPVVFYGSSITQGASASRSGNLYQNILSRRFHFDYINLGFASGCKAEESMIDYLCTLTPSLFVFDYDHNARNSEFLRNTHLPALRRLREAHPEVPFAVLSKPNQHSGEQEAFGRARIIEESCRILRKEGSAPLHFINGQEIFCRHDAEMMTLDGTHPTDLGFFSMAEALCPIFEKYFT